MSTQCAVERATVRTFPRAASECDTMAHYPRDTNARQTGVVEENITTWMHCSLTLAIFQIANDEI